MCLLPDSYDCDKLIARAACPILDCQLEPILPTGCDPLFAWHAASPHRDLFRAGDDLDLRLTVLAERRIQRPEVGRYLVSCHRLRTDCERDKCYRKNSGSHGANLHRSGPPRHVATANKA